MFRLATFCAAALASSHASTTCLVGTGDQSDWGPSCEGVGTDENGDIVSLAKVCFASYDDTEAVQATGCLPAEYADSIDLSESGCDADACWCLEDDCNNATWAAESRAAFMLGPKCYGGIAGANSGPDCYGNQLFQDNEYESPSCHGRVASNICLENNPSMGQGDGCPENSDRGSCEAYRAGERDLDDSFDGTTNHCRWAPELDMAEKLAACEADEDCKFWGDRGDCSSGNCTGNCETSEIADNKSMVWEQQRGMNCNDRLKRGCLENNAWMGDDERCTANENENACLSIDTDCDEGICTGNATAGAPCSEHHDKGSCGAAFGCTFEMQCCQWIPEPTDLAQTCATKGAGTLGVCSYSDGDGAPSKMIAQAGFEHGLFRLGAKYEGGGCAMVASFRPGFGSATAFGSNKADLIGTNCERTGRWESLAEHIGHTNVSIEEYCENFVPDASAMSAFSEHSPGAIIAAAKAGQFATLFPGLKDSMFIVTKKPEFGECLFASEAGEFGAAVCVCRSAECNNQTVLEFIVDPEVGPMRLLQFIDGSLVDLKDDINAIVPDLMDASGKVIRDSVGGVTEADVDAIMLLDGVDEKTNKVELWGIIQDYQRLNTFIEEGGDPDDPDNVPVAPPVSAPVSAPVAAPVTAPVSVPVTSPVEAPVTAPIAAPVTAPVSVPVASPVVAPVTAPAAAPVTAPVSVPVASPVVAPVTAPAAAPVNAPVSVPVASPVVAPVTDDSIIDGSDKAASTAVAGSAWVFSIVAGIATLLRQR